MTNKEYFFSKSYQLNRDEFETIESLQRSCSAESDTAFKLELHYKMAGEEVTINEKTEAVESVPFPLEYFCYFNKELVGYLGIVPFGGRPELMGMVHPQHRRKGIFKELLSRAFEELRTKKYEKCLLLSDRKSESGQAFMQAMGFQYESSEYEMKRSTLALHPIDDFVIEDLMLRVATNADASEIANQNAVYFKCDVSEVPQLLPEEEAAKGMKVYMAEVHGQVVGKIHLQQELDTGWIYGLGVMPTYRGLGYGRGLLIKAVERFREQGLQKAALQVAVGNETALSLYTLSGFQTESTMDYFICDLIG